MLMKNWIATPTTAAHRKARPALEAMYGYRMYSPLATPTPTRITLGPISLRSAIGSGMSRSTASPSPRGSSATAGGGGVSVLGVVIGLLPRRRSGRLSAIADQL